MKMEQKNANFPSLPFSRYCVVDEGWKTSDTSNIGTAQKWHEAQSFRNSQNFNDTYSYLKQIVSEKLINSSYLDLI